MKAAQWVDRVKKARGWTDYRAAAELGITRGAMSQIRTGNTETLSEDTALKVADLLGVDPAGIVLDQYAEKAKSEVVRSALREVADQRLYIMLSSIGAALSKAAEVLPAILMPGVKSARTRHA